MNKYSDNDLNKISKKLRKKIIEISYKNKAHHIGSELSCIDILSVLFHNFINLNTNDIFEKNSDIFILSKGHASLAYYTLLAEKNFFNYETLINNFLSNGGLLGGHPDYNSANAVQVNSGSLGYGISVGSGFALIAKKQNLRRKVFVLLGDGECNEGSIWESVLFASHQNLNNLIIIVDQNKLQGLGKTEEVVNMQSLLDKFTSFGCESYNIDGHNISEIDEIFLKVLDSSNNVKPKVIIASTVKGKGVKSMEGKLSSHYETLTKDRYEEIIKDLDS
jgi:transketolase